MAFLGYIDPDLLLGRWLMILGSFGVLILLPFWRIFYWSMSSQGFAPSACCYSAIRAFWAKLSPRCSAAGIRLFDLGYFAKTIRAIFRSIAWELSPMCSASATSSKPTRIVVGMAERRLSLAGARTARDPLLAA